MQLNKTFNQRGVSLIIVIFAMMLFAVLGWTLAVMQSTDFEANLRNLDSERALGLAEAGAQWGLNQLSQSSSWRTSASPDADCDDADDWISPPHSLSPGQYRVCCRNPCVSPPCGSVTVTEDGDAVLEVRGYIPQVTDYRAMRQIKLEATLGSLINAVQTPPPDVLDPQEGLFNWWPSRQAHSICIEGTVSVGHYDGDGDATYDEDGQDYDDLPAPILPLDCNAPANSKRGFSAGFPSLDMAWFYVNASNRWPDAGLYPPTPRQIVATATVTAGGNQLQVTTPSGFFTGMNQQAVRRNSISQWWLTPDADYRTAIMGVLGGGTIAVVSPNVSSWPDEDPGTPGTQVTVKLVRRYTSQPSGTIQYIGNEIAGGTSRADLLIDLSWGSITFQNKYLICEGDIVIKGTNQLLMRFTGSGPRYPVLGTKDGNIISEDTPSGFTELQRMNQRQISGLIYSEFGEVSLNYLRPPTTASPSDRGNLVYGHRVTLDGGIQITYLPGLVSGSGFDFSLSQVTWQEQ